MTPLFSRYFLNSSFLESGVCEQSARPGEHETHHPALSWDQHPVLEHAPRRPVPHAPRGTTPAHLTPKNPNNLLYMQEMPRGASYLVVGHGFCGVTKRRKGSTSEFWNLPTP